MYPLLYAQVGEAALAAKRGEGEILFAPLTKIAASLQHYSSHTQFASDILHQVSLNTHRSIMNPMINLRPVAQLFV
jgi:hypothetical protein